MDSGSQADCTCILSRVIALESCKEGWVNYDKSCYRIVSDSRQSWTNARDVCRRGLNSSMNGDLVTIDDQ